MNKSILGAERWRSVSPSRGGSYISTASFAAADGGPDIFIRVREATERAARDALETRIAQYL